MKRIFNILIVIFISVSTIYGNENFDMRVNNQYENAYAYEGEILYLLPLTKSFRSKFQDKYHFFKDYSFKDNSTDEYQMNYNYKFDIYNPLDNTVGGTHKRHIEGHRFYVDKVVPYKDYKRTWVFHLTDLDTGEKLKYIYHSEDHKWKDSFEDFPFIVKKHYDYCKTLIGTNLVFATNKISINIVEYAGYYYPLFKTDFYTDEPINYSDIYAKWKIVDVNANIYYGCLCFLVTNGKNIVQVPYNFQYYYDRKNIGNRVFPEKVWNTLVNKYGEPHMRMIMNTEMSEDMTLEEKYMAGGCKYAQEPNAFEKFFQKDEKEIIEDIKKESKEVIKQGKTIYKTVVTYGNVLSGLHM